MSFESTTAGSPTGRIEVAGPDGHIQIRHPGAPGMRTRLPAIRRRRVFPQPRRRQGHAELSQFLARFRRKAFAGRPYSIFRDHLLTNVCDGDPALFKYVFGWMAHIVQKPRAAWHGDCGAARPAWHGQEQGWRGAGIVVLVSLLPGWTMPDTLLPIQRPHGDGCRRLTRRFGGGYRPRAGSRINHQRNADDRVQGRRSDPPTKFRSRDQQRRQTRVGLCRPAWTSAGLSFSM